MVWRPSGESTHHVCRSNYSRLEWPLPRPLGPERRSPDDPETRPRCAVDSSRHRCLAGFRPGGGGRTDHVAGARRVPWRRTALSGGRLVRPDLVRLLCGRGSVDPRPLVAAHSIACRHRCMRVICRRCSSSEARPSRRLTAAERLAALMVPFHPFRCRHCNGRFWALCFSPGTVVRTALLVAAVVAILTATVRQ